MIRFSWTSLNIKQQTITQDKVTQIYVIEMKKTVHDNLLKYDLMQYSILYIYDTYNIFFNLYLYTCLKDW